MTAVKADTELKMLGLELLSRYLGMVEAERFISLMQRERFDYTQWRQTLFAGASGEELSCQAMLFQQRKQAANLVADRTEELSKAQDKP